MRTTLDGLRRSIGSQHRILAAFEPRSNTMKIGTMKAQLPWALEAADLAFCHTAGLDWDASAALAPLGVGPGQRAQTAPDIAQLVAQITQAAQPGDHIVCMSNGAFGGIHNLLLQAPGRQKRSHNRPRQCPAKSPARQRRRGFAIEYIAACARRTGARGRFGSITDGHGRHINAHDGLGQHRVA